MDSSQQKGSDIARTIWIVGSPIIFTIGVFGNIMTIIVLTSRRNKKTSSSIFLTFLAVGDLLVMTIMLPRWWLIYMFGFDVRHVNNVMCKLHFFFTYFSGGYSASLLAVVTIERTISTVKPYKVKTMCTVNSAVVISVILVFVLGIIHGHILYGMKLYGVTLQMPQAGNVTNFVQDFSNEVSSTKTCEDFLSQINDTEAIIDMSTLSLEFEAQCDLFNSSYIGDHADYTADYTADDNFVRIGSNEKWVRLSRRKMNLCWYDDPKYGQYFSEIHQIISTVCYIVIPEAIFFIGGIIIVRKLQFSRRLRMRMLTEYMRDSGYKPAFDNRATQITLTLLLVNVVFVVTTTPAYIFLVGRSSWVDQETGMTTTQEIVWATVNQMVYINHAVNFILYFLSGFRFRQQVLNTFRCRKSSNASRGAGVTSSQFESTFST